MRAPPRSAALAQAPTARADGPVVRAAAEVFEDHMAEWLLEFQKYLTYENPALVEADPSKESVVDQVRATRWRAAPAALSGRSLGRRE